ncbi:MULTISPECIES: hypothetical protein [Mycobacteriaceae]|uniref:Uncharacterized protein n=1 Tax=Mycolicibacterium fluoranthenivorans TaxID=258505 RepID=A0A1G4WWU3_9MYCO|nr:MULTISPECIES: hypothetical protein [Mycobacteriaceae]MCV7252252.1 hypothetical protein [Mycobacterium hackensackense]SCX31293.1 hypothetical protein SAMN02799620_05279 [Mycolicibacterium fluoranthenivorans]
MNSNLTRRVSAAVGGVAILAMIGFTAACGNEEKKTPETSTTTTTTTTSTTAPSVEPTEKSISPSGGNKFTPTVKAPPAPTAIPGDN